MLFYILIPLFVALALLVVVSVVTAITAVGFSFLPVRKVPLRYNLRNLQVRWKTTLVTALAFTLVTALLVIMLAFVHGMDRVTQSSAIPGNVIVLADGATDETFSNIANPSVQLFPDDVQKAIQKITRKEGGKNVREFLLSREVYVLVSHIVKQNDDGGRKRRFIQMRGISDPEISAQVHEVSLASGKWWSASGVRSVPDPAGSSDAKIEVLEVVLGDGIARILGSDLGKAELVPDDIVQIGPNTCVVAGVMNPKGSYGSEVWGRDTQIQQIFNRGNRFSSFVLRTADDETGAEVAAKLKKLSSEKYNASTETEYYKRLEASSDVFRMAIWFLGAVMAIGGVLGVTNTMFAAISQRAKDIGVLRLLGYTRFQILCSFLMESILIALIGGLLGCAVGYLFNGMTATSIASGGQGGGKSVVLQLAVDFTVMGPALLLALVMGAVGGFIPSINAMRLRPLESLR